MESVNQVTIGTDADVVLKGQELFVKFPEIENCSQEKIIELAKSCNLTTNEWVVMEKVHGANFSFIYDGEKLYLAKRTAILTDKENKHGFFNHNPVVKKYQGAMVKLWQVLKGKMPDLKILRVYGEIYGGYYPTVKVIRGAQLVQKHVHYNPDNDFYAFDIHYTTNDGKHRWMNYSKAMEFLEQCGFFWAKPLFIGTFDQALKYEKEFQSKIPEWLNSGGHVNESELPKLPVNTAEGVVIKPVVPVFFPDGQRLILKNKIPFFDERTAPAKLMTDDEASAEAKELAEIFESYACENRLDNTISKVGPSDRKAINGLFIHDTYEAFMKEHKDAFLDLDPYHQEYVKVRAKKACSLLVLKRMSAPQNPDYL